MSSISKSGTSRCFARLARCPHAKFTPAIWIRDNGAITVRSVETLAEVVAFLDHWPYARRDPAYQTAMDLAQKATVGYVTVDAARDAFWAFAAEAKILAESNVA